MAIGCYQDNYFTVSYKGVSFQATDVSSEHGRRGAEGEFPFGENTAYADLGRRIRTYQISGRFQENSHIGDAAALIAVCETPGPGILIHPTRGPVLVACRSLTVTDNPEEMQGITEIELDFVEANPWGVGFIFGVIATVVSLVALSAASEAKFRSRYRPDTVQGFRRPQVAQTAGTQVGNITTQFKLATAETNDQKIWKAYADLDFIQSDVMSLLNPDVVAKSVTLGLNAIDAYADVTTKYEAFRSIANSAALTSSLIGDGGDAENAIYAFVRTLSAGYMVRAASETTPATMTEAFKQYDQVVAILEQERDIAKIACDNYLFLAISEFLTQAQTILLNRAYTQPALVQYNFGGSVHALVAAYQIYGDAKRSREVEARNPASWPWAHGPAVTAASPV